MTIVPVSVLWLANNQIFQLGILEPDRVGRFYPERRRDYFFFCYLALKDIVLWSIVFRKKSWMIFWNKTNLYLCLN